MELSGKKGIGNVLKIFLQICFYGGIIVLIALPFVFSTLGITLHSSMYVIYPNGIVMLAIGYKFIQLFNSLKNNNPFCEDNIKIQKSAAKLSIVESVLWFLDFLYSVFLVKYEDLIIVLGLAFLSVLFFGVAIALYILSELFKQAYKYKEENDLTI